MNSYLNNAWYMAGWGKDLEDAPMLEAVQQRLGENTDILSGKPRPVALPGDTSAVHARNILKKLIKQEKQTT